MENALALGSFIVVMIGVGFVVARSIYKDKSNKK